jgi:hypothetical protein
VAVLGYYGLLHSGQHQHIVLVQGAEKMRRKHDPWVALVALLLLVTLLVTVCTG